MSTVWLRFCFDVQCPFAYLASKRVKELARVASVRLEVFPVLLGGLYDLSKAPQGKDGSATSVMNSNKQILSGEDLYREGLRHNTPIVFNSKHPIRSVRPQRLLASISDDELRYNAMARLYDLYWKESADVSDLDVLQRVCKEFNIPGNAAEITENQLAKDKLRSNTAFAAERGAFGVPTFFIMEMGQDGSSKVKFDRFFFGQDRTFFVAKHLGIPRSHPLGSPLRLAPSSPIAENKPTLTYYFDLGSPWAYLGSLQVERVAQGHGISVIYKPVLLGALFKMVGAPNVPMMAISEAKRNYGTKDMKDWLEWHGGASLVDSFRFPSFFPVRTVLPLRVLLYVQRVAPQWYISLVHRFFHCVWIENVDIGKENVLLEVLSNTPGIGAQVARKWIEDVKTDEGCRKALRETTQELMDRGGCGVPSFYVNGHPLVFGQDRMNVVEDFLAGWSYSRKASL